MGIELPSVAPPAAAYVPFVHTGDLVFVSGHIARKNGQPWQGKLGNSLTTSDGKEAARLIAIDLMATLQLATGDLNRVTRIVSLMVLVNSGTEFTKQHLVANGASGLITEGVS